MRFFTKLSLIILALSLTLSLFIGCEEKEAEELDTFEDEDGDYIANDYFPEIERKDYGADFNLYIMSDSNPRDYFYMDEDNNDGSPMDEAVFARQTKVNRYLGIDILRVDIPDATWSNYNKYVQNAVQNMDGTMDALLTHVNGCVGTLISDNLIIDLSDYDGINLEAEYWNMKFMDSLELKGNYYLGFSDYNLLYTYAIAFNKDMLARYDSYLGDRTVYDLVSNYEWTLDEMISLANLVYIDATGDGKTTDDTYGITGTCWVSFCGWLTSSDIPILHQDESGAYVIAINSSKYIEKADNLVNKLKELGKSNSAYFDYEYSKLSVPLRGGKSLMQLISTNGLSDLLSYNIEFGVLPYPMYDLDQASVGYKSLQWGGYQCVLSYTKNPLMVGETLELLSFYSENVKITFFEKLLGKQVADMPEDAQMLEILWDSVTTDCGQTFVGAGTSSTKGACYTVPDVLWPTNTHNLASYVKSIESSVNNGFKNFLKGIDG